MRIKLCPILSVFIILLVAACNHIDDEMIEYNSTEKAIKLLEERTGLKWKEVGNEEIQGLYIPYDSLMSMDWTQSRALGKKDSTTIASYEHSDLIWQSSKDAIANMNGSVFGVKYKFPFKLYLTYNVLVKNGYWWDTSLQFDIGELLLGGPVGELSIIPGSIKKIFDSDNRHYID